MKVLPFAKSKNLSFIHAGANDGTTNDWLYQQIILNQWIGVCLEPQKEMYGLLEEVYKDYKFVVTLNAALSNTSGMRKIYYFQYPENKTLNDLCNKLASFERATLEKNLKTEILKFPSLSGFLIPNMDQYIYEESVICYTIEQLLVENLNQKLDLLSLDIEGHEFEIISSIDFNKVKPHYIFFEFFHLSETSKEASIKLLKNNGYELTYIEEYCIEDFNLLATLTS